MIPHQTVMHEHKIPTEEEVMMQVQPFGMRKFDKPDFNPDPSLGMVKLDPQINAQAQIRDTLVKNYSAFMSQMAVEQGV